MFEQGNFFVVGSTTFKLQFKILSCYHKYELKLIDMLIPSHKQDAIRLHIHFHMHSLADPSDEVEFVEPVNTNSNDNGEGPFAFGGGFPIIIVRTSGQSPDIEASEGDFPFGSSGFNPFFRRRRPFFGNPNFEGFPVIPREDTDVDVEVDGHSENIGSILKTILGIPEDDREDTRADDTEPQQDDEQTEISSSDGNV